MDPVKERLAQLDKEAAAVTVEVRAAWEAYNHAAAATTQAALAQLEAPEDRKVQLLHDAAEREERRALEHYESLKEEKKRLDSRQAELETRLLSTGGRTLPQHAVSCTRQSCICKVMCDWGSAS